MLRFTGGTCGLAYNRKVMCGDCGHVLLVLPSFPHMQVWVSVLAFSRKQGCVQQDWALRVREARAGIGAQAARDILLLLLLLLSCCVCAPLPSMQVMLQDQALHLSDPNPDLPWAFKQVRGGGRGGRGHQLECVARPAG